MAKALFATTKVIFATHDTDRLRRPEYAIDRVLVLDEHAVVCDDAPAAAVAFYEDLIRRKYEASSGNALSHLRQLPSERGAKGVSLGRRPMRYAK